MTERAFVISKQDNVATALSSITAGEELTVQIGGQPNNIKLVDDIAFGHKFSLNHISAGENIVKYGEVIGRATKDIADGAHVHTHNVDGIRARGDLQGRTA